MSSITKRAVGKAVSSFNGKSSGVNNASLTQSASRSSSRRTGKRSVLSRCPMWLLVAVLALLVYLFASVYFVKSLKKAVEKGNATNHVTTPSTIQLPPSARRKTPEVPPLQRPPDRSEKVPNTVQAQEEKPESFRWNLEAAEAYLADHGPSQIRKTIGAYLEPATPYVLLDSINQGDPKKADDPGMPPKFIEPMPLRTFAPKDLKQYEYPKFQTCHDLPAKLPIDRGLELDADGEPIVWNVGDVPTVDNYEWLEAPYCPVDADPFLPWIHDMFPSVDGKVIEFIAHNRRRCKTGTKFRKDVLRMEPQVALMQPVSVERIDEVRARTLAPDLWHDEDSTTTTPRYRLAPFDESSPDGQETRFICQFYGTDFSGDEPQSVLVAENLSIYPFNYEYVSYHKGKHTMITPQGKDNKFFWTSVIRFQCPVPPQIERIVRNGKAILSDGTPTLHIDLIPIRTPPRFGIEDMYLSEKMIGPKEEWATENWKGWRQGDEGPVKGFDPKQRWGDSNVLPRIEASGRWTNLPICQAPKLPQDDEEDEGKPKMHVVEEKDRGTRKPHLLSACLWASSSFKTRGKNKDPILDTGTRLMEWIEFHLMVGFDHIYVFDNSGAQTNETSLAPILERYPKSQITRIEWPSIICNNNIPAHDNTGERSSQYTAENACRTRAAPFTEWIASFDTDEYLVPMGEHTTLRDVVRNAQKKKTNILTFRSSRARLRFEKSQDQPNGGYREMITNFTFMEAYNCDSSPIPKPEWAERARKQIYVADYVPYHYVHYSTVTKGLLVDYQGTSGRFHNRFSERPPSERTTDEANEAIMLHTKTTLPAQTTRWRSRCHYLFEKKWRGCSVGIAWPNGVEDPALNHTEPDGFEYNCFVNDKIETYWLPRLKEALAKRKQLFGLTSEVG